MHLRRATDPLPDAPTYAEIVEILSAVMVWGFLAMLVVMPIAMLWGFVEERRKRARGEGTALSSGSVLGLDDIWRPSAAEAQAIWAAEQITPAPAPIPGDGPGVIEGNRIVIETGLRHHR